MSMSILARLAMTVAINAMLAATGSATDAQSQSDAGHQQQQQQQQNLARYQQQIAQQQVAAKRHAQELERQKRLAHYRFQQAHYGRLRQQQERLQNDRHDFDTEPFYDTRPGSPQRRDARYHETNQNGVDALRRASNNGYQEGFLAGGADRQDDWRFDYRQSFAYQDANYGYDGRYVQQEDYNDHFREGFQRGYDDGYYDSRHYGRSAGGADSLLDVVLGAILTLKALR
jgi:hypothetical protein